MKIRPCKINFCFTSKIFQNLMRGWEKIKKRGKNYKLLKVCNFSLFLSDFWKKKHVRGLETEHLFYEA